MVTGWQYINNKWYYFLSSGAMVTGWKYINNKWYYFNSGGDMRTDYLHTSTRDYYFYSTGELYKTKMNISRQQQEQSKWCWAACASMIGEYITGYLKSQSSIVQYIKRSIVNSAATFPEMNNAIYYVSDYTKNGYNLSTNSFSYNSAVSQIDNNQLFAMYISWNILYGHYVVGAGYNNTGHKIYVIDPNGSAANSYYKYDDLVDGVQLYSGYGKWTTAIIY